MQATTSRSPMPCQFLVGQARARRVSYPHLPLKQIAQQLDRIRIAIQRKAQVRRQLPNDIILRIVLQDKQILFQSIRGLAFLQKLLRALHALPYLGSVQSFCDLRHAKVSGVNPAPILGAPLPSSNEIGRASCREECRSRRAPYGKSEE